MTTLREHVDAMMAAEGWCRDGAAIVQKRDPDTATWYAQVDRFQGFVNIWWIANPTMARDFVLDIVSDLVADMPEGEALERLGAIVDGDADLAECVRWWKGRNAETDCCNLVGRLAIALDGGSAQLRYGMLSSLRRSYQVVHHMGRQEADAFLLFAARKAAPLDVWRGSFD